MAVEWKVHTYASLPSTQDYVKELGEEGLEEGIVVQCLQQTKGRGRHGREWVSPLGNLYMSILLRPACEAVDAGQISFVVAVAMARAVKEAVGADVSLTLKWPNDVLINDKKCAGLLIESEVDDGKLSWLALGIGANVLSSPVDEGISIQDVAGDKQVPIHPFRDLVLKHFAEAYEAWQKTGFAPIREEWLENAHGLNQKLKVNIPGHEKEGVFKGIDETGALLLDIDGREEKIYSGEIVMMAAEG